ncbi:MAG: insulinase family protein [Acidobacteria bacterium]|jgi:zinc protease|nr:insulinase family protein [Acidobacteriota bacterium]
MKSKIFKIVENIAAFLILNFAVLIPCAKAQEPPPAPSAPRMVTIPAIQNSELPNGLKIAVVERKNVPLVTVSLLLNNAGADSEEKDGLANTTASLLTKGTKTRTATQIAEQIEFLGGNIGARANWNSTVVNINVTSDKLEQAVTIMSDVVLNPTFAPKEIELFKTQTNDELNVSLKQPGSLASFVASRYTFGEHNAIGTPESLKSITQADITKFYRESYKPESAVLIFAGDISSEKANALAKKFFGTWKKTSQKLVKEVPQIPDDSKGMIVISNLPIIQRILVIDLPNSGQAAVTYAKKLSEGRVSCKGNKCATDETFYPSAVANTVLGGGYSARLNSEIRIKRGLSYGASSNLASRSSQTNLLARAQTKNVSAAEVAELVAAEIGKLGSTNVETTELTPRQLTLTGAFGNSLETTDGLAAKLVELYTFGLSADELNSYMTSVRNVSAEQVKNFASANLNGGDIIIVGDAKTFMDDLKKRFPTQKIEVIAASDLDLNRNDLRKTKMPDGKSKPKS